MKIKKALLNTFLEHVIVIEIFTLLTIIVFYRIFILGFSKYVIGDYGDAWQFIWNIWWVKEKVILEGNFSRLFYTDYLFYPVGASLTFHTLSLFNSLVAIPFTFFLNLIATYNSLVLLSFILTGFFSYLLANFFLRDRKLSFLCSLCITFSSYHVSKMLGHFNLLKIEYLVLFFYFYFKSISKRKMINFLLAGILLGVVGLSEYHYFYFGNLFIGIMIIFLVFEFLFGKRVSWLSFLNLFLKNAIILLLGILILSPFLFKMLEEYLTTEEIKKYGSFKTIGIINYFLPSTFSLLYSHSPTFFFNIYRKQTQAECWPVDINVSNGIFLIPLLLLSHIFLIIKFRDKYKREIPTLLPLLLVSIFFILFSIGSEINNFLPFYGLVGSPQRFAVIPSIFLPLSFFLILKVISTINRKLKIILLTFFLIDQVLSLPTQYNDYPFAYTTLPPLTFSYFEGNVYNFSILNVPPFVNTQGMFLQTLHRKPIIDGHTSRIHSKSYYYLNEIGTLIEEKNEIGTFNLLKHLGTKYIILNKNYNHNPEWRDILNFGFVRIKEKHGNIEVYQII